MQVGDIVHPQLDDYGGLRPIVVPVGVDQDPHLRLTRDITQKTNWFNIKQRKSGGLTVALSIQDGNRSELGITDSGNVDMASRKSMFSNLESSIADLGFSDIKSNPKHGTIEIPAATLADKFRIRMRLLSTERNLVEWASCPHAQHTIGSQLG